MTAELAAHILQERRSDVCDLAEQLVGDLTIREALSCEPLDIEAVARGTQGRGYAQGVRELPWIWP